MVKRYISQQVVIAKPMSRGEFLQKKGWKLRGNESPDDMGYVIMRTNGESSMNWLHGAKFDKYYREVEAQAQPKDNTYIERLLLEQAELKERIEKLNTFVRGQPYSELRRDLQEDIHRQVKAMVDYFIILSGRIDKYYKK